MRSIAQGNLTRDIPYEHRSDEIGSLARGLRVFRDNAIEKQRLRIEKDGAVAASRAKSEFLANVSHELRTPLNAIIGFSELIKTEMFGPVSDRYRAYSTDIFNSGTHLLALINEILDLSKLEAGQLELHDEVVDMSATVEACLNLIKEPARKAGLHLSVSLDFDVPFVLADERRLRQILINLLSNAVKFTAEGGEVNLSTLRVSEGLAIEVCDTGIGIAAGDIPKVLTPFGQVDSKVSRQHEGTGLGLPLVKHLAELHGGTLNLASELNVGTTVTVLLPARRIVRVAKAVRA
jgi:signal transduction histidine kinase